ncbi:hypothetical protein HHI36_016617 [Cryptolaemus montrouzieri]|uniref:Uncharacterized protein n=1 Tax=Cryptolaemus montrouzieri TaxID=559131 RepID=A0ABD2NKD2_9CUCU
MLRTNFPQDGEVTPEGPHFYCQGDGLGVHPSIIAIDLEDEEGDASSESSSSTNGSANLTETQIENSMQDIVSLPDYDQSTTLEGSNDLLNIVPLCEVSSDLENSRLAMQNEESEEYFDTTDELTSSPKKLI